MRRYQHQQRVWRWPHPKNRNPVPPYIIYRSIITSGETYSVQLQSPSHHRLVWPKRSAGIEADPVCRSHAFFIRKGRGGGKKIGPVSCTVHHASMKRMLFDTIISIRTVMPFFFHRSPTVRNLSPQMFCFHFFSFLLLLLLEMQESRAACAYLSRLGHVNDAKLAWRALIRCRESATPLRRR